ncbi:phospholipase D-like domain-containing protein [Myxococcus hansupus]|nr:phospholipase D-like domain-containing protein [Myxococcus hansupus]
MFENFFRSQGNGNDPLEFLGKSDTVHRLQGLIDDAKKQVTLISPYVSIEKLRDLERKIRNALDRKVDVTLIMRAEDAHTRAPTGQGKEILLSLMSEGMRLAHVSDLHAKLYFSERHALITSLNLLESSFNNSIEIGVWVPANRPEYAQILKFIQDEIQPHRRDRIVRFDPLPRRKNAAPEPQQPPHGYCIRCQVDIEFDIGRPYCDKDFATWARYSDPHYEDKHCHHCGAAFNATKNKPLCRSCFVTLRPLFE